MNFGDLLKGIKPNDQAVEEYEKRWVEERARAKNELLKDRMPERYINTDSKCIPESVKKFFASDKTFCWIYGEVGTGKTHLLYAIQKVQLLNDAWNVIKIVKEYDISFETNLNGLIAIDDFGLSENDNRNIWLLDIYLEAIDKHYETKTKMIFTSNYDINTCMKKIGKKNMMTASRIISRFSNEIVVVKLEGNDRRKEKKD